MRSDLAVAGLGIAFGVAVLWFAGAELGRDSLATLFEPRSPALFPLLTAGVVLGAGVAVGVGALRRGWTGEGGSDDSVHPDDRTRRVERPWRVAGAATSLVVYYLALEPVGMVPASIGLIVILSLVLGFRRFWITVTAAFLVPVTIYFLFVKTLYVLLPSGTIWP